jgi:predicted metalloprotease
VIAAVAWLITGDPGAALEVLEDVDQHNRKAGVQTDRGGEDELADFARVVLADTEDVWTAKFAARQSKYAAPILVLFEDEVLSACGRKGASMGPFYCPADYRLYIDLSFFRQLDDRYGAPGDFAQAYVIAHEVGHHIQNLVGVSRAVHDQKKGLSEAEGNALNVKMELQADCFAGIWAHYAQQRQLLEPGDVEEGMAAAAAIGDDTLQKRSGRAVAPESWTHGSSKDRMKWFMTGFTTGEYTKCHTYGRNG